MTNEAFLILLDEQLKPLVRKYINRKGQISNGRTVTAVQLNIENCMDDADEIQKEMMAIANNLKKEHGIVADADLKQQISAQYLDTLNSISTYRITGKFTR
jgi:threonine synthase